MWAPWIWALLIVIGGPLAAILAITFAVIWSNHKRKMEELQLRRDQLISPQIEAEFAFLREEIRSLRDTTLQYDLSFDTALQQTEMRLARLESQARTQSLEQQNVSTHGR